MMGPRHLVASAIRRSALALLVGFWLSLLIWLPPPAPEDVASLQRSAGFIRDSEIRSSSASSAPVAEAAEVLRLQRRALPLAEAGNGVGGSSDHHPGNENVRTKRDFLRERITSAKNLIDREVVKEVQDPRPGPKTGHHEGAGRVSASSNDNELVSSVDSVLITVKTTKANHRTRCPAILQTWFQLARNETFFFTDTADEEINRASGGHLVITGCPRGHSRRALSCKMNSEFDAFASSDPATKKWWCHFDDDNYVNVPALTRLLSRYDPSRRLYLGKNSIVKPIDLNTKDWGPVRFRFATGGAGFCMSRALADALAPHALNNRMAALSDRIRLPDDVTVGFLSEIIVGTKLTIVREFHSHLEELRLLGASLKDQISLSYAEKRHNFVSLEKRFPNDPTSFISVHCELFPSEAICGRLKAKYGTDR